MVARQSQSRRLPARLRRRGRRCRRAGAYRGPVLPAVRPAPGAPRWRCTDDGPRGTGAARTTAIADHNAQAILDAAEERCARRGHTSISAVAALAGVSRVTVYAHFPTWGGPAGSGGASAR